MDASRLRRKATDTTADTPIAIRTTGQMETLNKAPMPMAINTNPQITKL